MDYEGVNSVVCDAEESDWLDVSYSERYVRPQKSKKRFSDRKIGKFWKVAAVAVACVAVLAALLFVDGDFQQDVFDAVKSAVASVFGGTEQDTENKIDIPCNLTLVDVNDGVMTFNGGRAAMSLTQGTVTSVTETSVIVAMDDKTSVIYDGLTAVMVNAGDEIEANSLLGKYDSQYTATITQNGEKVIEVVGSETQVSWNV